MKRIIYTAVINIALITNSLAQEPPPEIYHQSPDTLAIQADNTATGTYTIFSLADWINVMTAAACSPYGYAQCVVPFFIG